MNRWCVSWQGCNVLVEFKKDGEYVVPDPGSIKLTIRSNSGAVITGYDRQPQADVLSSVWLVAIPDSVNYTNEERETRFVIVEFFSAGYPCIFRTSYRLTSFLPIACGPEDVRKYLGVRENEVRDSEIDLYEAYFALCRKVVNFPDYLSAGSDSTMYANRAIAIYAALEFLPSLPLRAAKQDSLNNATLLRATIDWEALRLDLEGQLTDALGSMVVDIDLTFQSVPILLLTTPVDPITNA